MIGRGIKKLRMRPPRKQAEADCANTIPQSTSVATVHIFVARLAGSISRAELASDEASHSGSIRMPMPTAMRPSRAAWRMPTNPCCKLPVRARAR